jgi:DNA-binding IclR family transcriptional regulator
VGKVDLVGLPERVGYPFFEKRLPSVDRALDLLERLAVSRGSLTLSEISRKLKIPKSTTHYLIKTLASRGYLQCSPDGRDYSIGRRFVVVLGEPGLRRSQVRMVCSPYLRAIAKSLGLTAHAAVLEYDEGCIVGREDPATSHVEDTDFCCRFDLHCTALGKALMVQLSSKELDRLFWTRGLSRHNSNTICSLETLKADLTRVKTEGFAINNEENTIGVRAVGAPIFNHLEKVVAAVSVHGPTSRMPDRELAKLGAAVNSIARDIAIHF